eukprot:13808093-Ditylum_brightwellii.AAC.1
MGRSVQDAADLKASFILFVTTTPSTVRVTTVVGKIGGVEHGSSVVDIYEDASASTLQFRIASGDSSLS